MQQKEVFPGALSLLETVLSLSGSFKPSGEAYIASAGMPPKPYESCLDVPQVAEVV